MSVEYIDFHFPGLSNVHCVFTTRHGGQSSAPYAMGNLSLETGDDRAIVMQNRRDLQSKLGFRVWQELHQVHEQAVYMDLEEDCLEGPRLDGDGMCTNRPGHALITKTADCQAILLADTAGKHVASLHCGWRGNAGNFPAAGVRKFCSYYGIDPTQVLAVRGPSLGPGQSEFVNFDAEWNPMFKSYFNPATRIVDLWTLTRNQLMGTGIPARNIFSIDLCTASSKQFFSYRRDKTTGRQVGLIWME